jgi:hypothetical protein
MSVEERNQYREQLRLAESDPQQKTRLEANHREEMQVRARAQGVTLDEPPEAPEGAALSVSPPASSTAVGPMAGPKISKSCTFR